MRRGERLNVLLITIDTLRADAVGAYGRAGVETPRMDRLAASGVRFARALAQNVVTLPSHANILSGRYPLEHGVRDNAGYRFPAGTETLATLLRAHGYRTGAFVSAFPLDSRFGLARGFDVYDDAFGESESHTAFAMRERPGARTVAAARAWIAAGVAPFFCWVHLYEPHAPYEPPEPLASRFPEAPYLGEVSAADAALGPLLDPLLAEGRPGETLVVLTADHGEGLGDHGEMTHGIFAYESTLRVPLILYEPGLLRPRVVKDPVRHVDILPTVLDALRIPPPTGLPGRSLLPLAKGAEGGSPPSYFEALSAARNRGWAPLYGVARGALKYIELPVAELYDVEHDPGEARNLAASQPQALEEMRALLTRLRADDRGVRGGAENAETLEVLRSLGYVAAAAPRTKERYTEDDDPKRLIALEGEIQKVIELYRAGDLPGALGLAEKVVRQRPDMALSQLHLAFLLREAGRLSAAVEAARKDLLLSPEDPDACSLLGAYLSEAGRAREAVALLRPYAARPDPDIDVVIAYGVALAGLGRSEDALAAFERVRRIDPSNAMALLDIGTVHLSARRYEKARDAMEAALALDPGLSGAHNALGVMAAEQGRSDEAVEQWKRAASLDPKDHQILFNLGSLLMKLGRAEEARPYLERYLREAPARLEARDIARVRGWLAAPHPPRGLAPAPPS